MSSTAKKVPTLEHDLSRVLNELPALMWTALPDGQIDFVNQRLCEYTGPGVDEAAGNRWQSAIHPGDLTKFVVRWQFILTSGKPGEMEARLRRFDGEYRWFLISINPMRDEAGQVVKWFGVCTDIDDRKRAEEALHRSEVSLRLIVDSIPMPVAVTTPAGEVEALNQPTLDYFGKTFEELKGWKSSDVVHPDDLQNTVAAQMEAHQKGHPYNVQSRHRRADGTYRWFNVLGLPLRDAEGNILRWFILQIDIDDRKRVEEALRSAQRDLNQIINTITALVWSARPDGSAEFFNQHYLDYVGLSAEEMSGWGWTAAIHPDDLNGLAAAWQRIRSSEASGEAEARLRRFDGEYRWFLFRANPLLDESGNIVKWYGINTDITETRLALERLQSNQELLDLAQKSARAMAFDWYVQQDVNIWSPEQEALYGLQPGSFDGKYQSWKKLIYPPDWPLLLKAINHAHETGEVAVEFRVEWPDGSLHWLATNGQMFFDDQGQPFRMVGFTSDVSRRKIVEENLRRSEAFLAEAQHLSSMGSFSWRVATNEIKWSEQLYRIYEFEIGVPVTLELIRTRVHPEDISLLERMIDKAGDGASNFEWQYRLMMPDTSIKHLHAVAHATRDQDGQLEYIAAVQDVTERRLSEEALGEVRSELAHMTRVTSLGALTASIAHEVNQPLSGIITNASTCVRMLDADPPNIDGARKTAQRTIRDSHRASDVITRLRALFTKKEATIESVDLNDATREVIALSFSELQGNRVVLLPELADDLPLVAGDRVQLQQVILNLVRNASDAMSTVDDRPRQLLIRTEPNEEGQVRLSVEDVGVGFDPEVMNKLFDAFYTTKNDGMGIGLSVCRSIIASHHGRLWATPNEGPGATFSFSVPRATTV